MRIGKMVNILPSPAELARMARTEQATLTLTKATLDFFRGAIQFSFPLSEAATLAASLTAQGKAARG